MQKEKVKYLADEKTNNNERRGTTPKTTTVGCSKRTGKRINKRGPNRTSNVVIRSKQWVLT